MGPRAARAGGSVHAVAERMAAFAGHPTRVRVGRLQPAHAVPLEPRARRHRRLPPGGILGPPAPHVGAAGFLYQLYLFFLCIVMSSFHFVVSCRMSQFYIVLVPALVCVLRLDSVTSYILHGMQMSL